MCSKHRKIRKTLKIRLCFGCCVFYKGLKVNVEMRFTE